MVTSSIHYALYHVEDGFLKAANPPLRGSHRPGNVVMAEDLNIPVPAHPANTGDKGMFGMRTRVLSEVQQERASQSVESRPMNAATKIYTIDPLEKSSKMPFLQKGTWASGPNQLSNNWSWSHERNVQTSLSDTAFTYSKVEQGCKQPMWGLHFGQIATRPTFGKLKCSQSAHQATATLAHEMAMDKQLFSPFRTTVKPSLSMASSRSVTPMWSAETGSRQSSRASRKALSPQVQSMDHYLRSEAGAEVLDTPQHSDVFSMFSGEDFGRVASPAFGQNTSNKVMLARSCGALDGIQRSVIVLPDKWVPIRHMIKDEVTARALLIQKTQRQVLAQAPKHIMRHLHAQMRAHPDTPWQPTCFGVVQ